MVLTGAAGSACSRARKANAREVAYRAGVRHVGTEEAMRLQAQTHRTLYRFDVRDAEDYAAGHIAGFRHYPGRAIGPGDRHGGAGARRAHPADRQYGACAPT